MITYVIPVLSKGQSPIPQCKAKILSNYRRRRGQAAQKNPLVRDSSIKSVVDVQTHDSNMDSLDLAVYDCESSDDES